MDITAGPGPIDFDDDDSPIYEVEKICDSRKLKGTLQYFIHWKGYPESDRSWEPAKEFYSTCPDLVQRFHEEHPDKPRPLKVRFDEERPAKPRPRRGVMLGPGSNIGG